MSKWIGLLGLLCLSVVTSGCATVVGRAGIDAGYFDRGPYPATKLDAQAIYALCTLGVEDTPFAVLLVPFVVLDVPVSVIFDTILLPWDMVKE